MNTIGFYTIAYLFGSVFVALKGQKLIKNKLKIKT